MMISVEPAVRREVPAQRPHDPVNPGTEVTALLTSALAQIEKAVELAAETKAPDGFSGSLATAAELLRYTCKQAMQIELRPEVPAVEAMVPAMPVPEGKENESSIDDDLALLLPQVLSAAGVEWDVFGQPEASTLPHEVQQAIIEILREVLVNTARHAHAKRVTLHYFHGNSCFRMRVADDGRGFCLHHPRKSLGLARIRERAQLLGGDLRVESAPWSGTRVVFTLPIAAAALREDIPA